MMSKEKTVKQQARRALKGNIVPIIAGALVVSVVGVMLSNISDLLLVLFHLYDFDREAIYESKEWIGELIGLGIYVVALLASPLVNGTVRSAANAVVKGKNSAADVLWYFCRPTRYLRTLIVNLLLLLLFMIPYELFDLSRYAQWLFADSLTGFWKDAVPVIAAVCTVLMRIFAYMVLVHYPLMIYSMDDGINPIRCAFGLIGFSFRHLGALIRLLFSMIGWIALCFFILPMFYVVPYLLAACTNSARWLYQLNPPRWKTASEQ